MQQTTTQSFNLEQAPQDLAGVIGRNIDALLEVRKQDDEERGLQERIADTITRFTGSMRFVYLHFVAFSLWIIINLGWLPIRKFDPQFIVLAMFASVEAIFLSTFVLISQNRMQAAADKRADLDLHVSLLAEHEITRLVTLVQAMAAQMGIEEANDPELAELKKDVQPERVMGEIKAKEVEQE
jgi:uncharacterized membrane protein